MRFKFTQTGWMFHFMNFISIYSCSYLAHETTEFWTGYNRKRFFKLDNITFWKRTGNKI